MLYTVCIESHNTTWLGSIAILLVCRSVVAEHNGYSISYNAIAGQWLVSAVAVPSHQSPGFHFLSQLLDHIDVGLKMATVDIHSVSTQIPLHGLSYVTVYTYCKCVCSCLSRFTVKMA